MRIALLIGIDAKGSYHTRDADGKWHNLGKEPENVEGLKADVEKLQLAGGKVGKDLQLARVLLVDGDGLYRDVPCDPALPGKTEAERKATAQRLAERKKEAPETFVASGPQPPDEIDGLFFTGLIRYAIRNKLALKVKVPGTTEIRTLSLDESAIHTPRRVLGPLNNIELFRKVIRLAVAAKAAKPAKPGA